MSGWQRAGAGDWGRNEGERRAWCSCGLSGQAWRFGSSRAIMIMEDETLIGFLLRAVITRIKLLERVDLLPGKLDGLRHHGPEHVLSVGRCGQRTVVTEKGSLARRRQQGAGV